MSGPLGSWISELKEWVAGFEPGTLDGDQAMALLATAAEGERLFAAVKLLAAERVAATGVWQRGGHRSAADWLAGKTGTDRSRAAAAMEVAVRLGDCPSVAAEVRAGRLSEAQAHLITDAVAARPDAELRLIEYARDHTVRQLGDECRRVKTTAENVDDEAEKLHRSRSYRTWVGRDGAVCGYYRMTPEVGAAVNGSIEVLRDQLARAAKAEGRKEPWDAYAADALAQLITEDRGEGSAKRPQPKATVIVHVDYDAVVRGVVVGDEMCEVKGIPIPASVVQRLMDDCILRVLLKRGGAPFAITPGVRHIPKASEIMVKARDRECAVPGCDVRDGLEMDHIEGYAKGGDRSLENLVMLCKRHHDMKTYGGWRITGPHGAREWLPPDDYLDPEPSPEDPLWESPWVPGPEEPSLALAGP